MKNIFPFILRNIFLQIVPESRGAYGIFKIFWCARRQFFGYAKLMRIFDDARKKKRRNARRFFTFRNSFFIQPCCRPICQHLLSDSCRRLHIQGRAQI